MKERLSAFVSSTYEDLKEARSQVLDLLLDFGIFPIGMELFSSGEKKVWDTIKEKIDEADLFILIVAGRYGSTDENGMGYVEKEYSYAADKGIPMVIMIQEYGSILNANLDSGETLEKLKRFTQLLKTNHTAKFWTTYADLIKKISTDISIKKQEFSRKNNVCTNEKRENHLDYYFFYVRVEGNVIQCEQADAQVSYIGAGLFHSEKSPAIFCDRVRTPTGVYYHNFIPPEVITNESAYKRSRELLEFKLMSQSDKSDLRFSGEIITKKKLSRIDGGIAQHIPYKTKTLCVFIDVSESPFISLYEGVAKIRFKDDSGNIIEKTDGVFLDYLATSMIYVITAYNVPADCDICLDWENKI